MNLKKYPKQPLIGVPRRQGTCRSDIIQLGTLFVDAKFERGGPVSLTTETGDFEHIGQVTWRDFSLDKGFWGRGKHIVYYTAK
jgi:hypothetical protein